MRFFSALAVPVLLLTVAAPAMADDETGRIRVIGRASQEVAPDFASVEIGVETGGATPAAALDAASQAAKGIVASAREMGVAEADIGTSSITLQPRTKTVRQPDGTMGERDDGYTAGNRVRVRLAEMGKLGELMRRTSNPVPTGSRGSASACVTRPRQRPPCRSPRSRMRAPRPSASPRRPA